MVSDEEILNENFIQLGIRIKEFRMLKNLTLEELGLEIGLDKSAIFRIEKGKPISMKTFFKIAIALETKPIYFFNS